MNCHRGASLVAIAILLVVVWQAVQPTFSDVSSYVLQNTDGCSTEMGSWLAPTVVASVLALVLIAMISCIVHRRRRNRSSSRSRPPGVEPRQSSLISTPAAPPYDSPSNANDPITFILPPPSYDSAVNACSGQPVTPIPEYTAVQFISRYPADNIETTDVNDTSQPLQQSLSLSTSSLSIPPLTAAPARSDLAP